MRISDWSSDVCSSDLYRRLQLLDSGLPHDRPDLHPRQLSRGLDRAALSRADAPLARGLGGGDGGHGAAGLPDGRSEEHTSELQSLMRISYAVFCLKKKKHHKQ